MFDLLKKKEAFHHSLERCLPEKTDNAETHIIDNVSHACKVAAAKAKAMGYHSRIITSHLECEASEAARFISSIVKEVYSEDLSTPFPAALFLEEKQPSYQGDGSWRPKSGDCSRIGN